MDTISTLTIRVSLDQILPNPWQPRDAEDPEHIIELAKSILAHSLMQVPVARRVQVEDKMLYQLAFGHSRLAAYRLLVEQGREEYKKIPLVVRELSDQQMFDMAITENIQRKDLTPIEEARAMQRAREEFGKTSAQIGELFGIGESAVRNKIRLLHLPPEAQEGLKAGTLTEGAARALLTLMDLPESLRNVAEKNGYDAYRPSSIIRAALAGQKAEAILDRVQSMIRQNGTDLANQPFELTQKLAGDGIHGPCQGCSYNLKSDKNNYCLEPSCLAAKRALTMRSYLAQASAATGIQVIEEDDLLEYGWGVSYTRFTESDRHTVKASRDANCPNLRLVYNMSTYSSNFRLGDEGFPRAMIVCKKRNGFCTCGKAIETGIPLRRELEQTQTIDAAVPDNSESEKPAVAHGPAPLTAEDLAEIARQAKAQKRQSLEERRGLRDETARRFSKALIEYNPVIWRELWAAHTFQARDYQMPVDWDVFKISIVREIAYELGLILANRIHNPDNYFETSPSRAASQFNEKLSAAHLEEFPVDPPPAAQTVSVETQSPEKPAPGKTLAEIFACEEGQGEEDDDEPEQFEDDEETWQIGQDDF